MKHLVKRPNQNLAFEEIDTRGKDSNPHIVHDALLKLVSDRALDKARLGQDYVFIVGDCSGISGEQDMNFVLKGETGIPELNTQMIFGNAIFCRYNVVDEWCAYTELTEYEADAIRQAFNVAVVEISKDKDEGVVGELPVFHVPTFHEFMGWT